MATVPQHTSAKPQHSKAQHRHVGSSAPELVRTFTTQSSKVLCAAWCPSKKQIISGSVDGCMMLWNFKPQLRSYCLKDKSKSREKQSVLSVAVSATGESMPWQREQYHSIFASGSSDACVRIWKPTVKQDRSGPYTLKTHYGPVRTVSFSNLEMYKKRLLLTGSDDKSVKLWDFTNMQLKSSKKRFLFCVRAHNNWVRCARFSPNNQHFATCSDDKTVKLWDFHKPKNSKHTYSAHTKAVRTLAFNSDFTLASGGEDRAINLHDTRTSEIVQHYQTAHEGTINGLSFHPDGNYLLSCSADGALRIWDVREGRLLYTVLAHSDSVNCCEFSPDGNHFVSGSTDGLVMAWRSGIPQPVTDEPVSVPPLKPANRRPSTMPKTKKAQPEPVKESKPAPDLGRQALQAARASASRRNGGEGERRAETLAAEQPQTSSNEANTKDDFQACARALQIIEERLRLNEDAVAELKNRQGSSR